MNGATIDLSRAAQGIIEFDKDDLVYFCVTDAQGRMIAGNRPLPVIGGAPGQMTFRDIRLDGRPARMAGMALDNRTRGIAHVAVAETTRKRTRLANRVLTFLLLPLASLVVFTAALLSAGIGRSLAPLGIIGDSLAQRSHRDLTPLDAERVPREIRAEINAINKLMARLKQALEAQQRFIADAAHQLRTPVTVLKTQADLTARSSGGIEDLRAGVGRIRAGADRLERLVRQLLNLNRAEPEGTREPVMQWLDLGDVAEESIAALVPLALQRRHDIRANLASPSPVLRGDRFLLGEMVANLVDNAIRYTPDGGTITVSLAALDGRAELTVEDNGPGVAPEEREAVFRRFYRAPGAPSDGSGLGLAIVRDIAGIHGGEAHLEAGEQGKGLRAVVTLPLGGGRPE